MVPRIGLGLGDPHPTRGNATCNRCPVGEPRVGLCQYDPPTREQLRQQALEGPDGELPWRRQPRNQFHPQRCSSRSDRAGNAAHGEDRVCSGAPVYLPQETVLESGREGSKAAISCPWHPKERSIDTPPHRISNRHKERGVGIETAQPIEETPRRGSPPIPRFLHRPPIAGWEPNHCVYPDEHRSAVRQLASKLQQRLQIPAGALLSPDAATQ